MRVSARAMRTDLFTLQDRLNAFLEHLCLNSDRQPPTQERVDAFDVHFLSQDRFRLVDLPLNDDVDDATVVAVLMRQATRFLAVDMAGGNNSSQQ